MSALLVALMAMAMPTAKLVSIDVDQGFPEAGHSVTTDFGVIDPGMDFDEAIVSWNVDDPSTAAVNVHARAIQDGVESREFVLADWAYDIRFQPRVSVEHQKDDSGSVQTDTLHLNKPGQKLRLYLTLKNLGAGQRPRLKLLTVCFSNTKAEGRVDLTRSTAWGKTIAVPERAQNNYPNGGVLCSATSVSMMLWHYAQVLNRPELNQDVPAVEAGVWDSVYKGAGNWPFNTAYAGSFHGMEAYVSRLNGISDLEKWIDADIPVAISVSFDMLRGKPLSPEESGHLIVLTGFTDAGDPIVNDPAFKDAVHKTYPRSDFQKAWDYSHRTVYFIYPESAKPPKDDDGLWRNR